MTRHILGLFHGVPGGKAFRRHLSENAFRRNAGLSVLEDAVAKVEDFSSIANREEQTA
jgi:tRNA-dihydrouridine synthase A